MQVKIRVNSLKRLPERGATEEEVIETIRHGESFPAKYGRSGFRHNFAFNKIWNGKTFQNKHIEAFAVQENDYWMVNTVIVKYF